MLPGFGLLRASKVPDKASSRQFDSSATSGSSADTLSVRPRSDSSPLVMPNHSFNPNPLRCFVQTCCKPCHCKLTIVVAAGRVNSRVRSVKARAKAVLGFGDIRWPFDPDGRGLRTAGVGNFSACALKHRCVALTGFGPLGGAWTR